MRDSDQRFDVFVSYERRDERSAVALAQALSNFHGIRAFLDRWYLVPGEPWVDALERVITRCDAVALCVGPAGLSPWQQREKSLALDRQTREPGFRVIPVLLPGADPALGVLASNTWVDFRGGLDDRERIATLARAAKGEAPGADAVAARASVCPYRGLLHFREEDAPFFLGRESVVDELERMLEKLPLLSVVGASGSGKSSVVRAGLVPRIRRSRTTTWELVTMVPGDRPLWALAEAFVGMLEPEKSEVELLQETRRLAATFATNDVSLRDLVSRLRSKQPGTDRLLLVVDQWEELYTLTRTQTERAGFIDQLLGATMQQDLSAVLTLRGDFVGEALAHRGLADRLQGAQINVGPMTRDELHFAIVQPAKIMGLTFEPGLVERILDDVGGEPGHLPLLEFVLQQLWQEQSGGAMRHASYDALGTLHGAIASRAERMIKVLEPNDEEVLRRLFLRLARPSAGHDYTRVRMLGSEVPKEAWRLVRRLVADRLLVTAQNAAGSDATVEVAHEALIHHWRRLRSWLDRDSAFLLWRERMRAFAQAWSEKGEREDRVLHGAFLVEAEEWLQDRAVDLTVLERRYIDASTAYRARQQEEESHRNLRELVQERSLKDALQQVNVEQTARVRLADSNAARLRTTSLVLLALTAALKIAVAFASTLAREARIASADAISAFRMSSAELADLERRPAARKLLIASQEQLLQQQRWLEVAMQAARAPSPARVLFAPDQNSVKELRTFWWSSNSGVPDPAIRAGKEPFFVSYSPDGTHIVVASRYHVHVWRADGSGTPVELGLDGQVDWIAFSRDSKRLMVASGRRSVRVWGADGTGPSLDLEQEPRVDMSSFSDDGLRVLTSWKGRTVHVEGARGRDSSVDIEHDHEVASAAISPDRTRVLTLEHAGKLRVWRVDGVAPPVVLREESGTGDASFSPDGSRVLSVGRDAVALWTADGSSPPVVLEQVKDYTRCSATFSVSGNRIVTACGQLAKVWSGDGSGTPTILKHDSEVLSANFSADERQVVTTAGDRTARVWQSDARGQPVLLEHDCNLRFASFSPDGAHVLTACGEAARVWSSSGSGTPLRLGGPGLHLAALSPDRTRVALVGEGTLRLLRTDEDAPPVVIKADGAIVSASFNSDASRVLAVEQSGRVLVWQTGSSTPLAVLSSRGGVTRGSLSPDGRYALLFDRRGTLSSWRVGTGTSLVQLEDCAELVHDRARIGPRGATAEFSPDGSRLVTTCRETITLRAVDGRQKAKILLGHTGPIPAKEYVQSVSFSEDGTKIVSASEDRTARVWWTRGEREPLVFQHAEAVRSATFSPDGTRVLTLSGNIAHVWPVEGRGTPARLRYDGQIRSANFSRDGTRIVTTSDDDTARVWGVDGAGPLVVLPHAEVRSAAFTPDGERVVTTGITAMVWRTDGSGAPVELPGGETHLSPDGKRLLLASDGGVSVWPIDSHLLANALRVEAEPCLLPTERVRYVDEPLATAYSRWRGCEAACWKRSFPGEPVEHVACPRDRSALQPGP